MESLIGKKIKSYTLGCKLNFAETASIVQNLCQSGAQQCQVGQLPDICLINTCSVTMVADKKSRQLIHKIIRQYPKAYIIATGCSAQLRSDTLKQIHGLDVIIGQDGKKHVQDYLGNLSKQPEPLVDICAPGTDNCFVPSCSRGDRTRYFLKVQDGCNNFCSYCTVPFARGHSRNPSIEELVMQARQVAEQGGKEIVITGINIGDYGRSTNQTFFDLVKALDKVEGIERYRISSIEPNMLTDLIIDYVAQSKRFMPHFHIPLQCGNDTVLKLMGRHYDCQLFKERIERIKTVMPNAFIGVDVIVGMRGETPELFDDSCRFIESLPITRLHVFSYSERPGTRALNIPHVVSEQEKHDRSERLSAISDRKLAAFYQNYIGSTVDVLLEHATNGNVMYGFTDNYIKVEVPKDNALANKIVKVRINGINADTSKECVVGSFEN